MQADHNTYSHEPREGQQWLQHPDHRSVSPMSPQPMVATPYTGLPQHQQQQQQQQQQHQYQHQQTQQSQQVQYDPRYHHPHEQYEQHVQEVPTPVPSYHAGYQTGYQQLPPSQAQHHHDGFQTLLVQEVDQPRYAGAPPGPVRQKTTFNSKVDNGFVHKHTWTLEIVASITGLAAMTVAIILLVRADGRPLSEFAFAISFNTIISILGAVARATMVFAICSCLAQAKWNWFKMKPGSLDGFEKFDEASRGPWGGFWLVIWLRFR
jgi:hypothetical protein